MKRRKVFRFLEGALRDGAPVRLKRIWDRHRWGGFVVGLSEKWVLVHEVDGNTLRLNGYTAVRVRDVEDATLDVSFVTRALEARGESPAPQPDILLVDLPGLLSSADAHFPLVTVHPEKRTRSVCYIGRVTRVGKKRLTLNQIDPDASWSGERKHRLDEITRVQFGDGYADALWMLGKEEWLRASEASDRYEDD